MVGKGKGSQVLKRIYGCVKYPALTEYLAIPNPNRFSAGQTMEQEMMKDPIGFLLAIAAAAVAPAG